MQMVDACDRSAGTGRQINWVVVDCLAWHNLNQQHDWQPLCKPQVWHQVAARAGLSWDGQGNCVQQQSNARMAGMLHRALPNTMNKAQLEGAGCLP